VLRGRMPPRQVPRKSIDSPIECKNLEPENRFGQPSKILGAGIDPVPGSKNPHPCKLRKDAAPRISKSSDDRSLPT